jgi:glycosyltransferase involved in cell wall biosynthesis
MIFFDVTKTNSVRHRSGLARLNERLREELGKDAEAKAWTDIRDRAKAEDWFVTAELFSEAERPGFSGFLKQPTCRTAAIFADAIPMKHPHITWPQSVARHPSYMKMLARFERVWAISQASRDELLGYWKWLDLEHIPAVEVLPLGADLSRAPRGRHADGTPQGGLLCVGILEPRKNQLFLLDVCEELWSSGVIFDLHIVGRLNPHFGAPVVARIKALKKRYPSLHYHEAARDEVLGRLYGSVRATVFPTIAEGCGLPLLESLWHGVPCVCSDLPVLRENANGGGCLTAAVNSREAWVAALRAVLRDEELHARLTKEAAERTLPTWTEAAQRLRDGLR